jgi:hypothetical protein
MSESANVQSRVVNPAAPTVIYVMGAGRSGSTILGVALGNCAGVFYAGELDKWLIREGAPALGGDERTAFWQRVRASVDAADLFGYQSRALERSSALFSARKWRLRRRLRARYRQVAGELYRAIAGAAEATHVVDTSHYPLRARELQHLPGIELHLVFLVRDPERVVESLGRCGLPERRFGLFTANTYLWLTHLLSLAVFVRHPRQKRTLLRYEELVEDPERVLRDLLDRVGVGAPLPDLGNLHTGVPIQGNRLLSTPIVALQSAGDDRRARSRVTAMLQLPLTVILSRLAYRNGESHSPSEPDRGAV